MHTEHTDIVRLNGLTGSAISYAFTVLIILEVGFLGPTANANMALRAFVQTPREAPKSLLLGGPSGQARGHAAVDPRVTLRSIILLTGYGSSE